jgi:DNA-binding NarL/FixJ family response regulator
MRRAHPEEALNLWQALVDGTWSLVDHSDSDGRRFLLARRNEPGVRDPKALTSRERSVLAFAAMGHQNKYIGYLLGISAAAVSAHLDLVQRKLGLSCRPELIQRFAPLVAPAASLEERPAAQSSR